MPEPLSREEQARLDEGRAAGRLLQRVAELEAEVARLERERAESLERWHDRRLELEAEVRQLCDGQGEPKPWRHRPDATADHDCLAMDCPGDDEGKAWALCESYAERAESWESQYREAVKEHDEFAHELFEVVHGRRPPDTLPGVSLWQGLLANVRALRERVVDLEADLGRLVLRAGDLEAEWDQARDVLRALAAAARPFAARSADGSHGQTMEAESWLSVTWQAAQHVLGEGGPGTFAVVAREHLALVVGELTGEPMRRGTVREPELQAAIDHLTAALQAAAGRDVEVVQTNGGVL